MPGFIRISESETETRKKTTTERSETEDYRYPAKKLESHLRRRPTRKDPTLNTPKKNTAQSTAPINPPERAFYAF